MVDIRQIAVATAVAILSALFVILLVDLAYNEPNYSDFCKNDVGIGRPIPVVQGTCDYNYGDDYQNCVNQSGLARFKYNESGCPVFDKCDFCNRDFNDAQKVYNRDLFLIAAVVGLAMIFGGILWKIEFLGTGLMFGGIILLLYATVRYFGDADKLLRVLIILGELLIVLWIGYKKLYKNERKRKGK